MKTLEIMFEDDPAAENYDNHGVVYMQETIVHSKCELASLFKSPSYTWQRDLEKEAQKQRIRREEARLARKVKQ